MFSVPGITEYWQHTPHRLAQFLPGRIQQAFTAATANPLDLGRADEAGLSQEERDVLEAAREKALQAAQKLLDAAMSDPDATFTAYFKEARNADARGSEGPTFEWTAVEGLLNKRADLFRAAAANEEAMGRLWEAGQNAPSRKNAGQMLKIGWALCGYAQNHDHLYPPSLDFLFESGRLKEPLETKSVRTGRPYVYVAGAKKMPDKSNEQAQFVVLYDDEPSEGWYECVFASCTCGSIRESDLPKQQATLS